MILWSALVLIVGGTHVMSGKMTVGSLIVVINYLGAVYGPSVRPIAFTTGQLQAAIAVHAASARCSRSNPKRTTRRMPLTPRPSRATSSSTTWLSVPDGTQVLHDIAVDQDLA